MTIQQKFHVDDDVVRRLERLATMSERHSIMNYAVLHSGRNSLLLWQPETVAIMHLVRSLRVAEGLPIFYSMNTGANVFIYCFSDRARTRVESELTERSLLFRSSRVGGALRYLDERPAIDVATRAVASAGADRTVLHTA